MPDLYIGCSGFSYLHWRGTEELAADAGRIRGYLAGRDVAIYFNNDFNGHAPRNALELGRLLERG